MAEKLIKYYNFVAEKRGIAGKIELAKLTLLPGPKAALASDNYENISKFKEAVYKITGETAPDF